MLDVELNKLKKDANTPEDFRKQEIINQFKNSRKGHRMDQCKILDSLAGYEKEDLCYEYDEISIYNFANKRKERWKIKKKQKEDDDELKEFTDIDRNKREQELAKLRMDSNYENLNRIAKYNLKHRGLHKEYQQTVRFNINNLEDKLDNLNFKNSKIINDLATIFNICQNYKTMVLENNEPKVIDPLANLNDDKVNKNVDKLEGFFNQFEPGGGEGNELALMENREAIKKKQKDKAIIK